MAALASRARGGPGGGNKPPNKPTGALGRAHTAQGISIYEKWVSKVQELLKHGRRVGIEFHSFRYDADSEVVSNHH